MDRRRMDAQGTRALHREWRAAKLPVIVVLQNVLVAACLGVTLYVYWSVQAQLHEQASVVHVHIRLGTITGQSGNKTLTLAEPKSKRMMSVENDTIHINCTGPYIIYVDLCYRSMSGDESKGVLQLQVEGSERPASSIELRASEKVCSRLHNITYLSAGERATLRLNAPDQFKIMHANVALSYLLGSQCES